MTSRCITLGTRTSPLAKKQTAQVSERLQQAHPEVEFRVKEVTTRGDAVRDKPLPELGRGVFVKELEVSLLNGEIDLAVHSFKDLPTSITEGLAIAAITEREDARDVLVTRWRAPLAEIPVGARIGTGSLRRAAQLKALRPDLNILPIRGNVETRLRKAMTQDYDGVVLAAAGLHRLEVTQHAPQYLPLDSFLPAAGQGALAVEARADADEALEIALAADHWATRVAVTAEKAFLEALGGWCLVPIGVHGEVDGDLLKLRGMVATPDGSRVLRSEATGSAAQSEEVGRELANSILELDTGKLVLSELRG